jgi:hypothetical protein
MGELLKFFRCSNDFTAESVFLAVNARLGWLNVSCLFSSFLLITSGL